MKFIKVLELEANTYMLVDVNNISCIEPSLKYGAKSRVHVPGGSLYSIIPMSEWVQIIEMMQGTKIVDLSYKNNPAKSALWQNQEEYQQYLKQMYYEGYKKGYNSLTIINENYIKDSFTYYRVPSNCEKVVYQEYRRGCIDGNNAIKKSWNSL